MKKQNLFPVLQIFFSLIVILSLVFQPQSSASAATTLTIEPLTWNIIGLDSNKVTTGPNHFPIGARVCNTSGAPTTVTVTFNWDDGLDKYLGDPYINLRGGTLDQITLNFTGNGCQDAYFEVEVTRVDASWDKTRRYYITAADTSGTVSTPRPRELYVEHLVSQFRNYVEDMQLSTDNVSYTSYAPNSTMTLVVGQTYWIKLVGLTATQGYEQIESFINFPNTIFRVISVDTTYTAESSATLNPTYDKLYGDACVWENNPLSPNYRSCLSTGKAGGNITVTYKVTILSIPGAPLVNPEPLNSLVYDFSGSSYHYNADYSVAPRYAQIVDPNTLNISKNFSPDPIGAGGVSALTFTISNPNAGSIGGLNYTDVFPTSPAAMTLANATASNTCSGTLTDSSGGALNAGDVGIKLANGVVPGNGSCSITVNVTVPTAGSYNNTTPGSGYLYVGTANTGKFPSDTLTVTNAPLPPTPPSMCASPSRLASWDFNAGTQANGFPLYTYKASDVSTATTSYTTVAGAQSINSTAGYGNPIPGWSGTAPTAGAGWSETPTSMANYFQFTLDTSKYGGVYVTFDSAPLPNGDWANPKSNVYVNTSADGGGFTVYTPYPQSAKGSWTTNLMASAATTGTSTTTFRFGIDSGSKTTATWVLDNVTFWGCKIPNPPTVTKAFSPNPVAVGGTSTLTLTITNPNSTNLTGTVAVNTGSPTVTGTGTQFTTELAAGSFVKIGGAFYSVASIASNTSLTLATNSAITGSGLTISTSNIPMTGISIDDYLPIENLQGTVTTNGTTSVVGTGTLFTKQLATGSIVYIPSTPTTLTGTLAVTQGSQIVTGTGTLFSTQLAVGSRVTIASVDYTVASIASNTSLTLTRPYRGTTGSGVTATSYVPVTYTVNTITDDTNLTLTTTAPAGSGQIMAAGLTLTAAPATTCTGSTVTGASTRTALSLAGNTLTGTVAVTTGNATVTGTGTSFTTQLAVGSRVYINNMLYQVSAIASATSLTLSTNYSGTTASGLTMTTDSTNLTGTVAVTQGSATVTGTGTTFTTQLSVGSMVTIAGVPYGVAAIASNTSLTLNKVYAGTNASGLTMTKVVGLDGGSTCTVTATVKANAAGLRTNVTGTISSAEGGTNTTSTGYATANLTALLPPIISKVFSPNTIPSGGTSVLTFTIVNPNQNDPISSVQFTDTYPAGVTNTASPSGSTSCTGGSVTAAPAPANSVSLSGASIAAGGSCEVTVNVTSSTVTGNLTGTFAVTNGSASVTGTGTLFTTQLAVGRTIYIEGTGYRIASIASDTSLTLTTVYAGPTASGLTVPSGHFNIGGAVSHVVGGTTVSGNTPSDTLMVKTAMPKIKLIKQVGLTNDINGAWYSSKIIASGTSIYYRFTVENIGDVDFSPITVTDPTLAGDFGNPLSCTWEKIDPADTTPPYSYLTTTTLPAAISPSADPIAYCVIGPVTAVSGSVTNTATAHGVYGGTTYNSDPDSANYRNGNFGHLPVTNDAALPSTGNYAGLNLYNSGGAFHITGSTYLGASVPTEADGINNAAFTPETTDNGVIWTPSVLWKTGTTGAGYGGSVNVTVECPSPNCYLNAWFDWNNDGDLNDSGEQIFNNTVLTFSGSHTYTLTFDIPTDLGAAGSLVNGTFFTRFRLYDQDPGSYNTPNGTALNSAGTTPTVGEVEDYKWVVTNGSVTPVTLSYFSAVKQGARVRFAWSTETETGNAGFNLYAEVNGEKRKLNSELILSSVIDSLERVDYSYAAKVNGSVFYIEDVSIEGETRLHGPFELGKVYGRRTEAERINLSAILAEHQVKEAQRQSLLQNNMGMPSSALESGPESRIEMPSRDKTPTPQAQPLVKRKRTPTPTRVPRKTQTPVPSATPLPPSATPVPTDTLEPTVTNTAEPSATFEPTATETSVPSNTPEPTATETATSEPTATNTPEPTAPSTRVAVNPADLQLNTTLNMKVKQTGLYRVSYEQLRDAGLDLAGVPVEKVTVINRNWMEPVYVYMPENGTSFGAGGYIEFYGEGLDTLYTDTNVYTVQVVNGLSPRVKAENAAPRVGEASASYEYNLRVNNQKYYLNSLPGSDPWYEKSMSVTTTLKHFDFPVTVQGLADTSMPTKLDLVVLGYSANASVNPDHHLLVSLNGVQIADERYDGISEKRFSLTVPAGVLQEGTNTLRLTLPADSGAANEIQLLDQYTLTYARKFEAQNGSLNFSGAGTFNVTNLMDPGVIAYRVSADNMARLSGVEVNTENGVSARFAGTGNVEIYIVTSVDAMNVPVLEAARAAADLKRAADYLIIAHPDFIGGLGELIAAKEAQGLSVSVVDVKDVYAQYSGGVFDPYAIKAYIAEAVQSLGVKYVLFVGGDTYDYRNYRGLNSISFIPSLYIATGTQATTVPADPLYGDLNGDNVPEVAIGRFPVRSSAELAMMVSKTLAYGNKSYGQTAVFTSDKTDGVVNFKAISAEMQGQLPAGWSANGIHLDDVSVSAAKAELINRMNGGVALVNFIGHSGPLSWTFSGLFNTTDAAGLTNAGKPFVVVQWGCWNTYYVDPVNNYLVQKFLLSGDKGAAAVLGATTLADSESERLLGELLMPKLVTPGMAIGAALRDAKLELAQTHPELTDVLLGYSLMGDPAIVIQP